MLKNRMRRLDHLLVERGLCESREKARTLILTGEVLTNERVASKPGSLVRDDVTIRLLQKPPFVSRGGVKLAHALDEFHIDVNSQVALDVGASTGGFTDCLLKRGAIRVYALDVGYGQLDYRLRVNPKVVVMERVNARYPFSLPEPMDLATIDPSFISLEKVVPNVAQLVKPDGWIICLVKPQFEAGRSQVGKGGLVQRPIASCPHSGEVYLLGHRKGGQDQGTHPLTDPGGLRKPGVFRSIKGVGMEKRGTSLELEGVKLVGEVYIPEQHPSPALCLCHGVPRGGIPDPSDPGYPLLAERFSKAGFVTLIFNFRGTGDSGGNFDILGWTRDLEAALDYLYNMREVDRCKISVMGFSGGAAVSVYVAAKDHRVSSLITCACPTKFRLTADAEKAKFAAEHFRNIGIIRDEDFPTSVVDWMNGFNKVKPIEQVEKISPRPLLIIHGAQDDVVDPSSAWALYERAGEPKEILIVEGAGHRLRVSEKAMEGALNWLKAHFFGRD